MATQKVPITFLNGFSSRKDVLGVLSIPDMLPTESPMCRFFYYFDHQWGRFAQDFDFDGKSLTYLGPPEKAWWLLGKNGEAVRVVGSTATTEQIPGAGLNRPDAYGYVNTIKNIDRELYVCGRGRQVYGRRAGAWSSIAGDILTHEDARGFLDLDGTDQEHIYAVGWQGEIFFFDGRRWHRDDSPTNVHLTSVRCVSPEDVWIAGFRGTVLHGRFGRWEVIQSDDIRGNWYCVEEFNGTVYLAGNAELGYVEEDSIALLDVGLGRSVTTHRLHSKEGLLWSIGEKDILRFDGSSWTEILHPDNV